VLSAFVAASVLGVAPLRAQTTPGLIAGTRIDVRNLSGEENGRRIVVLGRESATDIGPAIVGDPTVDGATLRMITNGATSSDQTWVLDASRWRPCGNVGFDYVGPSTGDPVRRVVIKRTPTGSGQLRVKLAGDVGTQDLTVVPPNPGDDGGIILQINNGGTYCVAFGGAAGGTEVQDSAQTWRITKPTAQPGCPSP
jgi:hypothetical protein